MYTPSKPTLAKLGVDTLPDWPNEALPAVVFVPGEPASRPNLPSVAGPVHPYGGSVPVRAEPDVQRLRWAAGLCACFDACVPNCCMAWACPCVSLAQVYARLGLLPYAAALLRLSLWVAPYAAARLLLRFASVEPAEAPPSYVYAVNGEIYYGEGARAASYNAGVVWLSYALLLLGHAAFSLPVWLARATVRSRFQIPGDEFSDCCVSWWCPSCAIAQMAAHVGSFQPGVWSFAASTSVLPAFDRCGGMQSD